MRVLTSALLTLLCIGSALAQAFGRFGYTELPVLPGITVDKAGFVSKTPGADRFYFTHPSTIWKPVETTETGQIVALNTGAGSPQKVRFDLWKPGVGFYFEQGFALNLHTTGSPYLTWGEGTAADGIPTPDVTWILVSFKTAQPPLLFFLDSGQAGFKITGKTGDWTLTTDKPYKGWVRVVQPLGTAEIAANSAASLGQLTKRVFDNIAIWTQAPATLQDLKVEGDGTAVEATWQFDKPGAIVPLGISMSNLGGYPIRILSKIRRLEEWNDEGPITVTDEPILKVRFPIRRIPLGRSLVLGKRDVAPLGTVSPIDIPSVVELALENLLADRDAAALKSANDTFAAYLQDAVYAPEPNTNQQLPYTPTGAGIDLAACHALLMQSTAISHQSNSEANSLLTSVSWRRDAYTWRVWVDDPLLARRAGGLAALAGFLCPEPERRLQAAMFEAGLAAERGLGILRSRKQGREEPKYLEVMDSLRSYAFFRDIKVADEDPFGKALLSEVRVFGDPSLFLEKQGEALTIQWQSPDTDAHQIVFATSCPIDLELGNLKKLDLERALGLTQVRYVANQPGPCQANLRLPDWAKILPASAPVPRYTETQR